MSLLDPPPFLAPVSDRSSGSMTVDWQRWELQLQAIVNACTQGIGSAVALTGQHASITTTPMNLPALANGLYRMSYYARITTADAVSSSLQVAFGWTETAVTLSKTFAAITGNTVTTVDSQTFMMQVDQAASLTYTTTYASNTANAMKYSLYLRVQKV